MTALLKDQQDQFPSANNDGGEGTSVDLDDVMKRAVGQVFDLKDRGNPIHVEAKGSPYDALVEAAEQWREFGATHDMAEAIKDALETELTQRGVDVTRQSGTNWMELEVSIEGNEPEMDSSMEHVVIAYDRNKKYGADYSTVAMDYSIHGTKSTTTNMIAMETMFTGRGEEYLFFHFRFPKGAGGLKGIDNNGASMAANDVAVASVGLLEAAGPGAKAAELEPVRREIENGTISPEQSNLIQTVASLNRTVETIARTPQQVAKAPEMVKQATQPVNKALQNVTQAGQLPKPVILNAVINAQQRSEVVVNTPKPVQPQQPKADNSNKISVVAAQPAPQQAAPAAVKVEAPKAVAPVASVPAVTAPASAAPVQAAPVQAAPVQSTPVAVAPVVSAPAAVAPAAVQVQPQTAPPVAMARSVEAPAVVQPVQINTPRVEAVRPVEVAARAEAPKVVQPQVSAPVVQPQAATPAQPQNVAPVQPQMQTQVKPAENIQVLEDDKPEVKDDKPQLKQDDAIQPKKMTMEEIFEAIVPKAVEVQTIVTPAAAAVRAEASAPDAPAAKSVETTVVRHVVSTPMPSSSGSGAAAPAVAQKIVETVVVNDAPIVRAEKKPEATAPNNATASGTNTPAQNGGTAQATPAAQQQQANNQAVAAQLAKQQQENDAKASEKDKDKTRDAHNREVERERQQLEEEKAKEKRKIQDMERERIAREMLGAQMYDFRAWAAQSMQQSQPSAHARQAETAMDAPKKSADIISIDSGKTTGGGLSKKFGSACSGNCGSCGGCSVAGAASYGPAPRI